MSRLRPTSRRRVPGQSGGRAGLRPTRGGRRPANAAAAAARSASGVAPPEPDLLDEPGVGRPARRRAATYASIVASSASASAAAAANPASPSNAASSVRGGVEPGVGRRGRRRRRDRRARRSRRRAAPSPASNCQARIAWRTTARQLPRRPARDDDARRTGARAAARSSSRRRLLGTDDPRPPQVVVRLAGPVLEQVEQPAPVRRPGPGLGLAHRRPVAPGRPPTRGRLVRADAAAGPRPRRSPAPLGPARSAIEPGELGRRRVAVVLGRGRSFDPTGPQALSGIFALARAPAVSGVAGDLLADRRRAVAARTTTRSPRSPSDRPAGCR